MTISSCTYSTWSKTMRCEAARCLLTYCTTPKRYIQYLYRYIRLQGIQVQMTARLHFHFDHCDANPNAIVRMCGHNNHSRSHYPHYTTHRRVIGHWRKTNLLAYKQGVLVASGRSLSALYRRYRFGGFDAPVRSLSTCTL
jgi:hypothetical protein